MVRIWLSIFCCQMFEVEEGSPAEAESIRKGLILVPPEDVEAVRDMTLFGRRRWGIARSNDIQV